MFFSQLIDQNSELRLTHLRAPANMMMMKIKMENPQKQQFQGKKQRHMNTPAADSSLIHWIGCFPSTPRLWTWYCFRNLGSGQSSQRTNRKCCVAMKLFIYKKIENMNST